MSENEKGFSDVKKFLAIILWIIIVMSTLTVFAANESYADKLNKLGLFSGTDNGYELDKSLTREQAVTMLTRLLGAEKKAAKTDYEAVFDDVYEDRWSFPYVMYCYENKITNGTGRNTFSPEAEIAAGQFTALVLRVLGYEAEPNTALNTAVEKMLFSRSQADKLGDSEIFTRGDMVYIIYNALKTKTADGVVFAYELADSGVISDSEAEELDVYHSALDLNQIIGSYFN